MQTDHMMLFLSVLASVVVVDVVVVHVNAVVLELLLGY